MTPKARASFESLSGPAVADSHAVVSAIVRCAAPEVPAEIPMPAENCCQRHHRVCLAAREAVLARRPVVAFVPLIASHHALSSLVAIRSTLRRLPAP